LEDVQGGGSNLGVVVVVVVLYPRTSQPRRNFARLKDNGVNCTTGSRFVAAIGYPEIVAFEIAA
jgi:hypothetical protein